MSLYIDHIVLTVLDIENSINFYSNILGMNLVKFTSGLDDQTRYALKFGSQKINLHKFQNSYEPHAKNPVPGSIDICFLTDYPLSQWLNIFKRFNIVVEQGPILKTGATGSIMSIYIRDPDKNLIEISNLIND